MMIEHYLQDSDSYKLNMKVPNGIYDQYLIINVTSKKQYNY